MDKVWYILAVMATFAAIGNIYTPIEGVIPEGAVTDSTSTVRADKYVRQESQFEEYSYIMYKLGHTLEYDDLDGLRKFHNTLSDSGLTVGSVVSHPEFCYKDNKIFNKNFIPESERSFNPKEWKNNVKDNVGVYGKLVAKDFSYAILVVKMEQGFDEIEASRNLVEIMEGSKTKKWEWYFKDDIKPADPAVIPAGYILARTTMYGAINESNLTGASFGILLAFLFFWFFFRAARPAAIAIVNTGLVLLSTRASIGYMSLSGIDTAESAYTILAWASIIVASVSFHTHVFTAMCHSQSDNDKPGIAEILWKSVWRLIGIVLVLTALISAVNFLSLWTFPVKVIQDLGLHTAIGIGFALFFALLIFPYCISAPETYEMEYEGALRRLSSLLELGVRRLSAGKSLAIVGLVCSLAGWGVYTGLLPIGSQPLEYVRHTRIHDAVERMNRKGHGGFVTLDFAFRPDSGQLRSPLSVQNFYHFLQEVEKVPGVRRTYSILDDVRHISQVAYSNPVPATQREVNFVFQNGIQADNSYWKFQEQLESANMWRFTATTDREGARLGVVRDSVRKLAAENDYAVYPFGRNAIYPDVDQAIIRGKPRNVALGHGVVIFAVFLWLCWRLWNRKRHAMARSFAGAVLTSVPFIFSTGALVLLMIGFAIPLDVATAVITALAINASVDFALYFVHVYCLQREKGKNHRSATKCAFDLEGPAITADMVANSLCFSVLLVSPFQPIWQLGLIMVLMLISAWVGSLLLMPPTLWLIYV